jgi:hypothetical protein
MQDCANYEKSEVKKKDVNISFVGIIVDGKEACSRRSRMMNSATGLKS